MCKTYNKLPNDDWFEKMDPVLKLWLYESWCKDLEEENEFARSYSILQGSFANPEMASRLIKSENPDFESSDEDFERVSAQMLEQNRQEDQRLMKRRRRRRIVTNQ